MDPGRSSVSARALRAAPLPALILLAIGFLMVVLFNRLGQLDAVLQRIEGRVEAESEAQRARMGELSARVDDVGSLVDRQVATARAGSREQMNRLDRRFGQSLSALQGRLESMSEQLASAPAEAGDAISAAGEQGTTAHEQDLPVMRAMSEGSQLFASGHYAQACARFATVVQRQPANNEARLFYGLSLYRANPGERANYASIRQTLLSVLQAEGEKGEALEVLGRMSMEEAAWADASGYLKRLVAVEPGKVEALKLAGYCALYGGDAASAVPYFEEATSGSPQDAEALAALGDCHAKLGNAVQAEAAWQAALAATDTGSAAGGRAALGLSVKLARSAYVRGDHAACLSYALADDRYKRSALLRAYQGMSLVAEGQKDEGEAILNEVAASTDAQAAALAKGALARSGEQD